MGRTRRPSIYLMKCRDGSEVSSLRQPFSSKPRAGTTIRGEGKDLPIAQSEGPLLCYSSVKILVCINRQICGDPTGKFLTIQGESRVDLDVDSFGDCRACLTQPAAVELRNRGLR